MIPLFTLSFPPPLIAHSRNGKCVSTDDSAVLVALVRGEECTMAVLPLLWGGVTRLTATPLTTA